jgi:phosphohistidine swiveling domain-containing protein
VYGAFIEVVDPFTEGLPDILKRKYKLNNDEATDYATVLSAPLERSFLTQEKIDFMNLCLGKMKLDEFHKKWFWIDSNYKEAFELTKDKIQKRVNDEIKKKGKEKIKEELKKTIEYEKELIKKKKEIRTNLNLDKDDIFVFNLMEVFGRLIDVRKQSMMRFSYALYQLIVEISKRTKWKMEEMVAMNEDEVVKALEGKDIDKKALTRNKIFAVFHTPNSEDMFYEEEAKKIYDAYMEKLMKMQLKGFVACAPSDSVKGKVCVVIDTKKDKFEEGCILVTTMTRPDFMPLMRKAAAVITDEGGVTCHAAIVARELNKPCIIGTKKGTAALKTNDEVELDLKSGVVKVLK